MVALDGANGRADPARYLELLGEVGFTPDVQWLQRATRLREPLSSAPRFARHASLRTVTGRSRVGVVTRGAAMLDFGLFRQAGRSGASLACILRMIAPSSRASRSAASGRAARVRSGSTMNKRARNRLIGVTAIILIIAVARSSSARGGDDRRVLQDASTRSLERPALVGKRVKVGGTVVAGSWDKKTNPMTLRDPRREGQAATGPSSRSSTTGVVPSTFGDDDRRDRHRRARARTATIEADEMITKCPSKYESANGALPRRPAARAKADDGRQAGQGHRATSRPARSSRRAATCASSQAASAGGDELAGRVRRRACPTASSDGVAGRGRRLARQGRHVRRDRRRARAK